MAALGSDYTDCSILIYDETGNHLGSTTVTDYNKSALRIEVREIPASLDVGDCCTLMIMSAPSPCEYQGRVVKEGAKRTIALHHGHEKENRGAERFRINSPATIENLICNGKPYRLHTPLAVTIINISRSGVRLCAPFYSMSIGDWIQMSMTINEDKKLLIVEVMNYRDRDNQISEYGCRFLIASERVASRSG